MVAMGVCIASQCFMTSPIMAPKVSVSTVLSLSHSEKTSSSSLLFKWRNMQRNYTLIAVHGHHQHYDGPPPTAPIDGNAYIELNDRP